MGLFTLGRAIARGITRAVKESGSLCQINPSCIVRRESPIRQVGLNFIFRVRHVNNTASNLRRQACQNFLQRNASKFPLFAFAGFCFADGNEKEKEASVSSLFEYLSSDLNQFWKDDGEGMAFPSHFDEYNIGERLGKPSSNAAVYSADVNGIEVALKIMFNYSIPSDDARITQAFEREYQVLPCSETPPGEVANLASTKRGRDHHAVLAQHPNVVKLHGMFIDHTPLLHDSIDSYPMAVPRQYHKYGNGRNKTMCLVMPKYECTLREYLHSNGDVGLSNDTCASMFRQLLEGVAHLERHNIVHRDLKSDNVLVDFQDGGHQRVVITDFGCCLAQDRMMLPYNSEHVDRGGNFALLAPEIANAVPGDGVYLDYSKADAWSCGSLAYEIFTQDNPFYTFLNNTEYENEDLEVIPVQSGNPLIDMIVRGLLQKEPANRLSACEASTILAIVSSAPPEWLLFPDMVSEIEVERWLLILSIETRRKMKLLEDTRFLPPDIQLNLVFLSRITTDEILYALLLVSKLQNEL